MTGEAVEVRVRIAARPETVFRFLAEPAGFRAWMGEGSEIEGRPGGRVRVAYPSGDAAIGEVLEIEAGRRIVWSWGYESGQGGLVPGSTRVTIELAGDADGTLLTLRHDGLPSAEARSGHAMGWRYYAGVLGGRAVEAERAEHIERTVGAWFDAWNETDVGRRDARLAEGCTTDVVFVDRHGRLEGLDRLVAHIGGAQSFVPGHQLERTGAIEQCHEHVMYGWRLCAPDGGIVAQGRDFAEVAMDGRLRRVVGFWEMS